MRRVRTSLDYAIALLPGAAVVALGFQAGGFFPRSWPLVACVLALLLVLRVTLAERPFAGLSAPLLVALGALALLATWTLLSAWWSHAPARASVEYSRVLTYLLMLLVLGASPGSRRRTTIALTGVLIGLAALAVAGLLTRVRPDLLTAPTALDPRRLAWPVSYWNGLGLAAAVALLLALHLASWTGSSRVLRPFAAALLPPLAVTLYLTLSRGAIAAGALGLVVYLVLGRPRALVCTLIAAGAPTVIAVLAAYHAPSLLGFDPSLPGTISDGREVGGVVLRTSVIALLARAALLPLDARLARLKLPAMSPVTRVGAVAALVAALVVAAVVSGATASALQQGRSLLRGSAVRSDDVRTRLLTVDNDGRFALWRIALDAFEAHPLTGTGASTYELEFNRSGNVGQVIDAHSLYAETLGELGLVGLTLLAVTLLTLLGGVAWRAHGPDRPLHAAVLAALITWAAHAALDWDWELTAVSIWVFGLAGAALAGPGRIGELGRLTRVVLALGALVLALLPFGVWRSHERLYDGVNAFIADDCSRATDDALDALDAMDGLGDAWELLSYCNVRAGQPQLAVRAAREAVRLDPDNSDRHYALAIALARAGQDPRPAAADALRLNPRDAFAHAAVQAFSTGGPRSWARRAGRLSVPIR